MISCGSPRPAKWWLLLALPLALLTSPRAAGADDDAEEDDDDGPLNPYDSETLADPALRGHGWIALFTGAGLLAAGGVTGGLALHLNAGLEGDCAGGLCPPSRQSDLETRDALATSSTVLIATGFVAAMMGILILAVFAPEVETEDTPAAEGGQAWLTPRLFLGPGSAALEVRF
ncbi:MAG TPA: hypothetical protein VM285_06600 [Polyangia bacterium]|nr:hypothetical protein [Polyangia bacterium]